MSQIEVLTSVAQMRTCIEKIIKGADQYLCIISPYVKFDNQIKMLLEKNSSSSALVIDFVYGKKKSLEQETRDFLNENAHIRTHFLKDLHAKCYLNEEMALVTSMNLYDYSMINNVEMGVFLHNKKGFFDSNPTINTLYQGIRNEVDSIVRLSQASPDLVEPKTESQRGEPASSAKKKASRVVSRAMPVIDTGFCNRCGIRIVPDPAEPYCGPHFKSWNRFKNEEYEEKHCHLCGKEHSATRLKPACRPCWKKYKDKLNFPRPEFAQG